jgi:hypothetical protein
MTPAAISLLLVHLKRGFDAPGARKLGMTPAARLADGVATLGLAALVGPTSRPLLAYPLALLDKWNRTHNLTAIREPERMITHHLLDSLACCRICLRGPACA